jgi:hypothetical protein
MKRHLGSKFSDEEWNEIDKNPSTIPWIVEKILEKKKEFYSPEKRDFWEEWAQARAKLRIKCI